MRSPPAEIEVGEELVRALLAEQHPDLGDRRLSLLDTGWDNVLWRLGDDLVVRLPRRALAAPLAVHEQRWLPELAPRLPLPVPVPVRTGRPSACYPWTWSIVPWLDGQPGDRAALSQPQEAAGDLARFLLALHRPAPAEAPHNPYRSVPLADRRDAFEDRLVQLDGAVNEPEVCRVWDSAVTAEPWKDRPVWLHADLHPANVLVQNGALAAVLDFGDLCAGDPATDVAAAWMLLPASGHRTFAAIYEVDGQMERRALGWALLLALMLLAIDADDRPTYGAAGRAALDRVLAHEVAGYRLDGA